MPRNQKALPINEEACINMAQCRGRVLIKLDQGGFFSQMKSVLASL